MADSKSTNPIRFLREVRQEGRKVTWTPRQEVLVTTLFVLAFVTLMAIFFFIVDFFAARAVCSVVTFDPNSLGNIIECWTGERVR